MSSGLGLRFLWPGVGMYRWACMDLKPRSLPRIRSPGDSSLSPFLGLGCKALQ